MRELRGETRFVLSSLPAFDPNFDLSPPDRFPLLAMMTSAAKSRSELLRKTLKKNLGNVLSGGFRRRNPYFEVHDEIITRTNEFSSECNTLVDFAVYDSDSSAPSSRTPALPDVDMYPGSQEWNTTSARLPQTSLVYPVSSKTWAASQTSLLDEDECTWVKPRHASPTKDRKRRAAILRKSKSHTTTSSSRNKTPYTELLEPEERSFM